MREKPGGLGPVTEADLAVDRMLRDRLLAARPGYGWLSEESEDGAGAARRAARVFIVDPIDGTRAFLAGAARLEPFARRRRGRARRRRRRPPAGARQDLRRGARRRARAATARRSRRACGAALDGARVLATAGQLDARFWPGGVPAVERLFRPSIAYRLCLVADGTADAMLTFRDTWEWDLAAGALIAAEAGAVVTDARGSAARLQPAASRRRRRPRRRGRRSTGRWWRGRRLRRRRLSARSPRRNIDFGGRRG